jgi:hypothetical protein
VTGTVRWKHNPLVYRKSSREIQTVPVWLPGLIAGRERVSDASAEQSDGSRNPTGHCTITGYGSSQPFHRHPDRLPGGELYCDGTWLVVLSLRARVFSAILARSAASVVPLPATPASPLPACRCRSGTLQGNNYPDSHHQQPKGVVNMGDTSDNQVTIVDVKMPFMSMVVFMVKWVIAAIPAFIILGIIFTVLFAIFGGIISE